METVLKHFENGAAAFLTMKWPLPTNTLKSIRKNAAKLVPKNLLVQQLQV